MSIAALPRPVLVGIVGVVVIGGVFFVTHKPSTTSSSTPASSQTPQAAQSPTAKPGAPAQANRSQTGPASVGLPTPVKSALDAHKVVVILFWQPKAAEDKAVRKALTGIDRHHNKVLAHATHIKRVASYQQITRGAEVEQSPTVVVIDRNRQVESLVGYVDRQTIDQAVTDALRNSRKK